MDKKTLLYGGGIILVLVVLYSLFKSQQAAQLQLATQGQLGVGGTVNQVLNSVQGSGIIGTLTSAFKGVGDSNAAGLFSTDDYGGNDPGLDDEDEDY